MLLIIASPVFAAVFKLTSIGTYDVSGGLPSHVWYTSLQPSFEGAGTTGATVNITVDSTSSFTAMVGSNEEWNWTPLTPFPAGDHNLTFSSGTDSVSFILTSGSATSSGTATNSASSSGMPETGSSTPILILSMIGGLMIVSPLLLKLVFKKQI